MGLAILVQYGLSELVNGGYHLTRKLQLYAAQGVFLAYFSCFEKIE
jgi:hypothetical protein